MGGDRKRVEVASCGVKLSIRIRGERKLLEIRRRITLTG